MMMTVYYPHLAKCCECRARKTIGRKLVQKPAARLVHPLTDYDQSEVLVFRVVWIADMENESQSRKEKEKENEKKNKKNKHKQEVCTSGAHKRHTGGV